MSRCKHEEWTALGVAGHRWCERCGAFCQVAFGLDPEKGDWVLPSGTGTYLGVDRTRVRDMSKEELDEIAAEMHVAMMKLYR